MTRYKKNNIHRGVKAFVVLVVIAVISLYSTKGLTSLQHGNLKFIVETAMNMGSAEYLATIFDEKVVFDTDNKSEIVDQKLFKIKMSTFFEKNKLSSIELVSDNTFNLSERYLVWIYHSKNSTKFKVSVKARNEEKEDHYICDRISIETVLE